MLKKIAKSIREYKKPSLLAMLYVSGEVLLEVLIPLIMAELVDKGIEGGNMNVLVKLSLALFISAVISLIFGAFAGKHASVASCGFAKNLRKDMYERIQQFSFSNIDKFSDAGLITRLTSDVTHIQMAYQMIVRTAVRSPAMMIFSLIAAFSLNRKLSLVFLIFVPVLSGGLLLIMRHAHPVFEKVFRSYDKLNKVVKENLHGIRVVKTFVREEVEEKKFEDSSTLIYNLFTKAESFIALNAPLMQFCMYSTMLLISWFGAKAIIACGGVDFTTGELISLLTYSMQILMSLMMLSMIFVMITISRAACERIVEILDEESDITSPENAVYEIADGSVVFKNVSFSYSGRTEKNVLDNINIEIKSGETVGIIGGTGSSKSSLISLIPRLYDVKEGAVFVGGRDVREYNVEALRSAVSVVLQKNTLFFGTVAENLRWGNKNATDEEIKRAAMVAEADSFVLLMEKGYDSVIEQGGANLSGGQRQRLCIARALVKNPKILILDDSTSAVDTKTDAKIRKALRSERPEVTKIIIAQRIASVADADKIIVMEDGKINGIGTHDELLKTNEIYKSVYETQAKGAIEA